MEIESAIRSEVRFLDEKLQTLMGRMIPLLKRTWLKIDELDKRPVGPGASDQKLRRLREELWREMKRLELDLSERTRLILDRVEGNIQNQGRLWLTLVRQLSSLTEQRKELQRIVDESREDWEPVEEPGTAPLEPGGDSDEAADPEPPPARGGPETTGSSERPGREGTAAPPGPSPSPTEGGRPSSAPAGATASPSPARSAAPPPRGQVARRPSRSDAGTAKGG